MAEEEDDFILEIKKKMSKVRKLSCDPNERNLNQFSELIDSIERKQMDN